MYERSTYTSGVSIGMSKLTQGLDKMIRKYRGPAFVNPEVSGTPGVLETHRAIGPFSPPL